MAGGGLLQLVAYGAQDIYLVNDPLKKWKGCKLYEAMSHLFYHWIVCHSPAEVEQRQASCIYRSWTWALREVVAATFKTHYRFHLAYCSGVIVREFYYDSDYDSDDETAAMQDGTPHWQTRPWRRYEYESHLRKHDAVMAAVVRRGMRDRFRREVWAELVAHVWHPSRMARFAELGEGI